MILSIPASESWIVGRVTTSGSSLPEGRRVSAAGGLQQDGGRNCPSREVLPATGMRVMRCLTAMLTTLTTSAVLSAWTTTAAVRGGENEPNDWPKRFKVLSSSESCSAGNVACSSATTASCKAVERVSRYAGSAFQSGRSGLTMAEGVVATNGRCERMALSRDVAFDSAML